jgi:heme exporter protein D
MPDLGPHASFIIGAYAITVIAVTALVLAILKDDRHQRHLLAELQRQGIRRRSAKPLVAKPPAAKPPSAKPVAAEPLAAEPQAGTALKPKSAAPPRRKPARGRKRQT